MIMTQLLAADNDSSSLHDVHLLNDSKYRAYSSSIEKVLKSFEYTSEWADLISALAKLNKVISNHSKYDALPRKVTVSKRLAQCLHPALPSGVHMKALDVYQTIFTVIGSERLAADFPIYSSGMLPALAYAAMTVKPMLLKLYEEYLLPLGKSLKPFTAGLVLGILPGLEEGSDFYDWTNGICERLSSAVGPSHFYTQLWQCLLCNASVRLPGTMYFLAHIEKGKSMEDQIYMLGSDLNLLVNSLQACLTDSVVLVQRNALDVLNVAFPFHSTQLVVDDYSLVLQSALTVLLRRDMSLNRRLYSWMLGITSSGSAMITRTAKHNHVQRQDSGSSSASEPELEYFHQYARKHVSASLQMLLREPVSSRHSDVVKPLRIVISLLDRPDIGSAVLEDILWDIFRLIRRYYFGHKGKPIPLNTQLALGKMSASLNLLPKISQTNPNPSGVSDSAEKNSAITAKQQAEILKTSNLFFGTLESHFLWEFLADVYEKVLWPSEVRGQEVTNMAEFCDLVDMLLDVCSLETYAETQSAFLPRLLNNLITLTSDQAVSMKSRDLALVLHLCRRILGLVMPILPHATESKSEKVNVHDSYQPLQDIILLLTKEHNDTEQEAADEALLAALLLLTELSSFPVYVDTSLPISNDIDHEDKETEACTLPTWLNKLLELSIHATKLPSTSQLLCAATLIDLISLNRLAVESNPSTRTIGGRSQLEGADLVTVCIQPSISSSMATVLQSHFKEMLAILWGCLNPESRDCAEEITLLVSSLLSISDDVKNLQCVMSQDLINKDLALRLTAYKRFALYWHMSRDYPSVLSAIHNVLMIVLSSLGTEAEAIQEVVRDWLIHTIHCGDILRVVHPVLIMLLHADTSRTSLYEKSKIIKQEVEPESNLTAKLEKANSLIRAISSDGKVTLVQSKPDKSLVTGKEMRSALTVLTDQSVKPTLLQSNNITQTQCDCDNVTSRRAGMAVNPFGDAIASQLDDLIFDGYQRPASLTNKWMIQDSTESTESYDAIVSRAKRLDKTICDQEGISFIDNCSNAIPLPETVPTEASYKMEPPPLDDPEALAAAEEIIENLINCVMLQTSNENIDSQSVSSSAENSKEDTENNSPEHIPNSAHGANAFILLYDQCYDVERVRYAFSVLKNVISINPKLVLSSLTVTSGDNSEQSTKLLSLLARHRRRLQGQSFYDELAGEDLVSVRNTRTLEILLTVCLHFWRGYFRVNHSGYVQDNSGIQMQALDLLIQVCSEIKGVLANAPRGFPHYMADVMARCKLQKICLFHLQCLMCRNTKQLAAEGVCYDPVIEEAVLLRCIRLTEVLIVLEAKLQRTYDCQLSTLEGSKQAPLFKKHLCAHPTFMQSLLKALDESKEPTLHQHWLSLTANILPHIQSLANLSDLVTKVISKVCFMFDELPSYSGNLPPDYMAQLLQHFTAICHFCFVDVTSNSIGREVDELKAITPTTGRILSNLVNVFSPLSGSRETTPALGGSAQSNDPRLEAKEKVLSMLPKILASLSTLWRVSLPQHNDNSKVVQLVVEFFSPVLHNYTEQLLGSIAVVWSDVQEFSPHTLIIQTTLIDLFLSIKALPMDTIVDKLRLVMKKPPNTDHTSSAKVILQISCLRFLRGYIHRAADIPRSSLESVCTLLKHCLQLSLPSTGVLLLLETVNGFVLKLGNIDDRKILKELQEICGRVLEACCQIASSQLETSSWAIRRNYTVKVRNPADAMVNGSADSLVPGISVDSSESSEEHETADHTAAALQVLAQVTAGLLDVVYPSEDKDKLSPFLTTMLVRIFPYLRNHSLLNMTCFQASSQLLANISSFPYTRKAWRREVYDLYLTPSFFQMDLPSLQHWKILIDNLVTHEKALFRDLLAKFAITGNATMQLFSSKEVENAQRAVNLKKLSFLLYCGEVDHYRHYLPEIQERLADNLRLSQSPTVLCQVFLCFRILLLRMSSRSLVSLWPTMITELVHLLTQIQMECCIPEDDEISKLSEADATSWLGGASQQDGSSWLQLYLSACKLLDLLLFLPPCYLPEFQHYAWTFTGDVEQEETALHFIPHVQKIAQTMQAKFGECSTPPREPSNLILQEQSIACMQDLQPFFRKLSASVEYCSASGSNLATILQSAECVIENDLIEIPT